MRTSVHIESAAITLAAGGAQGPDGGGWAERDALLLVCGAYPDKKLVVTERDLDDIVAAFSAETVPIKVEHVDSPLDPLGTVRRVWRDGAALRATLGFDAAVAPFLAKRPVGRLSVGLDRDAATRKLSLAEVSLVLKPRLATAALLSGEAGEGESEEEAPTRGLRPSPGPLSRKEGEAEDSGVVRAAGSEEAALPFSPPAPSLYEGEGRGGVPGDDRDAEIGRLRGLLAARDVDERLGELRRQGKVVPAIEPLARALLSADGGARITLSDGADLAVADTAFRLLSALPRLVTFGETAPGRARLTGGPGGAAASTVGDEDGGEALPELTPAQRAFCRDVLRVDPALVRRNMAEARLARSQG